MYKPITLLIVAMMLSLTSYNQVIKFRVFQFASVNIAHPLDDPDTVWKERDVLMVINFDKKNVKIYSEPETDLDWIKELNQWVDDKGDTHGRYSIIDQDGKKCIGEFIFFKDITQQQKGILKLSYTDYQYIFKLKKTDG